MKSLTKKIYLILFFLTLLLVNIDAYAKSNQTKFKKNNMSNYFSGIIFANQNDSSKAFKYLKKVQSLKNKHSKFNTEFIRTLVLLGKFEEAFNFSKSVWNEDEYFFEADLLLGLNYFLNQDYISAEKHFVRLNKISNNNLLFKDFFGNILMIWNKASEGKKKDSYKYFKNIPSRYDHLKKIQNSFLQCYFDTNESELTFEKLAKYEEYNLVRYNFFAASNFLFKNQNDKAKKIIKNAREKFNSNLLLKETEYLINIGNEKKIKNFFDCQNETDIVAEFFYIMANLHSGEQQYKLSNFYLKISLFLNKKFISNRTLLAENYYYQKKYNLSHKEYNSLKTIGPAYSWYASTSIATILLETNGKEFSITNLEKEFNSLKNPTFEQYYELANFYKNNDYFKKSIKYYSLALNILKKEHALVPKIFDRRGTSYERVGEWEKAEADLLESLRLLPDQPHVLNYLGYSWIDKGINLDKGLEMLIKANSLRENDGYILDSVGWAYFAKKDYVKAQKFLEQAVQLMPLDPIINDHYADSLWMLDKNIQARYFWNHILSFDKTKKELRDVISKKLIFGINKKL